MLHLLTVSTTDSTWIVEVLNSSRARPLMEANALDDALSE